MMAAPDCRARRADSNMLAISSIRALIFAKASSFWMMVAPDGRAQRADSNMLAISSIRALVFEKASSFWMLAARKVPAGHSWRNYWLRWRIVISVRTEF